MSLGRPIFGEVVYLEHELGSASSRAILPSWACVECGGRVESPNDRHLCRKCQGKGGRPPGADPDPDPDFPGRYYRALVALWNAGRTDIPLKVDVAAEMGMSKSTFARRREIYPVPWPPPWPPE